MHFKNAKSGNIAVPAALTLCALTLLVGGAVDVTRIQGKKESLQSVADGAALSAAREMAIIAGDEDRIAEVAKAYVHTSVNSNEVTVTAIPNIKEQTITVSINRKVETVFPTPLPSVKNISVTATAKLSGEAGNICMVGLSEGVKETISMTHNARLTAESCTIYSNSADKQSMYVSQKAVIKADTIILAGGFEGKPTETLKEPITDAPPLPDPLLSRAPPKFEDEECDFKDLVVTGYDYLIPGIYCGGLEVVGGTADLRRGEYIIKNGPLTVAGGGTLIGEYVGFYLTGDNAKIDFQADSHIDLSAPKTGVLTGLLFFADASSETVSKEKDGKKLISGHLIRSDDARRLVGTIYLPDDKLIVDGVSPVADKSEYTVILAKAFQLNNGPNLVIQTDYSSSDIPVPDGVGPVDDPTIRLVD